jgi:hypothetical protein
MNEFFEQFPEFNQYNTGTYSDFVPTHAYHQWITGENPNWPYIDNTAVSAGQIALQCSQPYTGDLCDYPLLIHGWGMIISVVQLGYPGPTLEYAESVDIGVLGVTQMSAALAYDNVLALLAADQITQADATVLVPDLNGDGIIDTYDLNLALDLVGDNIVCMDEFLNYTGNMCDYPWLLNDEGILDPTIAQTWYDIAHWFLLL